LKKDVGDRGCCSESARGSAMAHICIFTLLQ
jgi:hypothetical protein